jgi:hypothetical protein
MIHHQSLVTGSDDTLRGVGSNMQEARLKNKGLLFEDLGDRSITISRNTKDDLQLNMAGVAIQSHTKKRRLSI